MNAMRAGGGGSAVFTALLLLLPVSVLFDIQEPCLGCGWTRLKTDVYNELEKLTQEPCRAKKILEGRDMRARQRSPVAGQVRFYLYHVAKAVTSEKL